MSNYLIPLLILVIIIYGFAKHVNIYDEFLNGAKEGLIMVFNLIPPILAMVFAIDILLKSGIVDWIVEIIAPVLRIFKIPSSIIPMALLRPVSGNASLAIMNNIFKLYGPDSIEGRLASTIQGCTDTTIYVLALYFGSIKVTKTKYALKVGLFADLVGIVAAIIIVYIFFK